MKTLSLQLTRIAVALAFVIAFFSAVKGCYEQKRENQRLRGVINTLPQRSAEPFVDSLVIPIYRDSVIYQTQLKTLQRTQHASVQESSVPNTYADSVAKALKIGLREIERLTRINTQLRGELKKKDIQVGALKQNEIRWKNRYIEIAANVQDSSVEYRYNAKLSFIDFSKKEHWYAKRQYFTAVYSEDPNLRINGVQQYIQPITLDCPRWNVGVQGGYGAVYVDSRVRLAPYIGVGLQWGF